MTDPKRNTINGRHIYFTSLLADISEDNDNNQRQTKDSEKYNDYLEVQLRKHLIDRLKFAAFESKNLSLNPKHKFSKDILKLVERNCVLYECLEKENQHFLQSLHDRDEWEEKKAEYIARYEKIMSEEVDNVEQESNIDDIERSKSKAEQSLKKKRNKALMLEELSKCLLMRASTGTNVDYLQDERIRDIFFTDKC